MTLEEIARNWNPPDSLGYSSLRPVRLARGGVALAVIATLFVIGGVILGVMLEGKSRREARDRDLLRDQGVLTEATVLRVWRTGGKDSKDRVRYRFEVQGREFITAHNVPGSIWRSLEEGSRIPVRYVPDDPAINHPSSWNVSVTPWFVPVLVPAMFAAFACLPPIILRRQWRLLSEGRAAPGLVTGLKKSDKTIAVLYNFRLLNGSIRKGRGMAGRKSLPAVGSVVCVLYDPENPRRNGLYPLPLVRLERS